MGLVDPDNCLNLLDFAHTDGLFIYVYRKYLFFPILYFSGAIYALTWWHLPVKYSREQFSSHWMELLSQLTVNYGRSSL